MAEERFDRRALLIRGAVAGAALALPAQRTSQAASRRPHVLKGGGKSLRDLRRAVRGPVITAGSNAYGAASKVFNIRHDGARPLAIVRAADTADVRAAVKWADRRDVRVVPRSGGHSYAGYSTGDGVLVIDVNDLRSISVETGSGIATIGAGAQLIDIYLTLADQGLTIPAGSCPSVGIGGLAQGGGFGLASRKLGLTCDNVVGLTVVTANGKGRTVDASHNEDLFWACRGGGGGNFGVATRFRLRTHAVDQGSHFFISFPWSSAADALDAWQGLAPHATDALTALIELSTGATNPTISAFGQYFGPESDLPALLAPLTDVEGANLTTDTLSYRDLMLLFAGCLGNEATCHTVGTRPGGALERKRFRAKSDYVDTELSEAARGILIAAIESRQADVANGTGTVLLDAYGGAINEIARRATAFVHRDALFSMQYITYYSAGSVQPARAWLQATWNAMRDHVSGEAYQNYIDPDLEGWQQAYYGVNYKRLRRIKADYDPDFRFRFPQAIKPA